MLVFHIDKQAARSMMENQLASSLRQIVVLTQKTDHIPPITTNDANPFPYQVYPTKLVVLNARL